PGARRRLTGSCPERLRSLHVGRLGALGPLDDLELHALTLGEGLVAVHRDRGEVDEDVVPTLALDEAVALLVREPLDGALSQPVPPSTTNDGPGTEPPNWSRSALSVAQRGAETSPRRARAAFTVLASMRAIVIGPTPPGTGVMWPARSAAPGSTSPTRPPSVRTCFGAAL